MVENSTHTSFQSDPELPLPTLDLLTFSQERVEIKKGQTDAAPAHTFDATLESAPAALNAPVHHKSTRMNFGKEPKRFRDQLYS